MDKKKLRNKINELKPWYQQVDFGNGIIAESRHSKLSGEHTWNYVKQLLPESLKGKRILDLGSNAGLFCIKTAQMEAKEVIGIEKEPKHLKQCAFLKEYFDVKNVKFINGNLENLSNMGLGNFDIVLAIAVLYWVGRSNATKETHYNKNYRDIEINFIKYITTITDYIIVKARGKKYKYNNSIYYEKIFNECGFDLKDLIVEKIDSDEYKIPPTHEVMSFVRRIV